MTTDMTTEALVEVHLAARALAEASLIPGQPFLGAWGVARKLGYTDMNSWQFDAASAAAYIVFKHQKEIIVDANGILC